MKTYFASQTENKNKLRIFKFPTLKKANAYKEYLEKNSPLEVQIHKFQDLRDYEAITEICEKFPESYRIIVDEAIV